MKPLTPQEFVTNLRKTAVDENLFIYHRLFTEKTTEPVTDPYWRHALDLFDSLPLDQQNVFFDVIKRTMIDTTSTILGVIDGVCAIEGSIGEMGLVVNGKDIAGELQDAFLNNEDVIDRQHEEITNTPTSA